jgi:NAD(P)-dependent dehydrogenase (short-subunit alcohol dehydrogenase family)
MSDSMETTNYIPNATAAMVYATYPSLADKLVVITGGGTGIGAALTQAFVGQGARVYFLDIADAPSEQLVARLTPGAKYAPIFIHCNLMKVDDLKATFAHIQEQAGHVHVLINNAANDDRHVVGEVTEKYFDDRMSVNLRHQFFCAQAVAPGMKALGGGVILNFGSISWHLAMANLSLYMTAKAGIEGLTRGLARDLGDDNIRVNCIIPGNVRTERQEALWHNPADKARILEAQCLHVGVEVEDVAALTLFLSSDNARSCTGRDYLVDGGWYGE